MKPWQERNAAPFLGNFPFDMILLFSHNSYWEPLKTA